METKKMVVGVCESVIRNLAEELNIEPEQLFVRIDLEHLRAKPVFAIFQSRQFRTLKTMNQIINAGGGKGFGMLIGMHLKTIIGDLFKGFSEQLNIQNTKELFINLHFKSDPAGSIPVLSVYHLGKRIDSIAVGEIIELPNQ